MNVSDLLHHVVCVWLIRPHLPLKVHTLGRFFHLTANDRTQESQQSKPTESIQVSFVQGYFLLQSWWFICVCQHTKVRLKTLMRQYHAAVKRSVSLYQSGVVFKSSVVRNWKIKRWRLRWAYWTVGCGNKLHNSECQSSDKPNPLYLHKPWSMVLKPGEKINFYVYRHFYVHPHQTSRWRSICLLCGREASSYRWNVYL